jgi:hypothetical protein
MGWHCVPVNCAGKIKHFAPKILAGLLLASPPPTTCGQRCHWVWDGPVSQEARPGSPPLPEVWKIGKPVHEPVQFVPWEIGHFKPVPPKPSDQGTPPPTVIVVKPVTVSEPPGWLVLVPALLGLWAVSVLWRQPLEPRLGFKSAVKFTRRVPR